MDESVLFKIASLPFDGNTLSGPRKDYIISKLVEAGLKPVEDAFSNIWVATGSKGRHRLYSSHMDVDMANSDCPLEIRLVQDPKGLCYKGIVDNAVGCYINMLAACKNRSDTRSLYVWTASEEEEPGNPDNWARSAHQVVSTLKRRGIEPEFCVAVDVSYPRLLVQSSSLEDMWDDHAAKELFDFEDITHAYIDGISRPDGYLLADLIRRYMGFPSDRNKGLIRVRDMSGWDEAHVYSKIAPSFAFGPVGFGKYDEPGQLMPRQNVKTAAWFLRHLSHLRCLTYRLR